MKHLILLIILLLAMPRSAGAQQPDYPIKYDKFGNRAGRNVIVFVMGKKARDDKDEEKYSDELEGHEINLYPNPTRGLLRLEVTNLKDRDKATARLFNLDGIMLQDLGQLKSTTDINLRGRSDGVYMLRIRINEKVCTWKIIKKE